MNSLVKASLNWINSAAYPQEEFDNSNDENKVKCAARALSEMEIEIDEKEVTDYCRKLGMPTASIKKIVDWYTRPKNIRLKNGGIKISTKDLKESWENFM